MVGTVTSVDTEWNALTSTLHVRVELYNVSHSDAQKYRGTSKYRILSYCRSILVYKGGKVVFDPRKPLDDTNIIEHLVGDEEGKTLTQIVEMAANVIGATWLGDRWDKQEEIEKWIKDNHFYAKIVRWNIEPTVYGMLKAQFEGNPDFEFEDSRCKIIHHKANAWIGTVTEVIETPLTETFIGKASLFGEVISYLGIQWPNLYNLLMEEVMKNHAALHYIYEMAGEVDDAEAVMTDPFIVVDPDIGTKVIFGSETKVVLAAMTPEEALIVLGIDVNQYAEYVAAGTNLFKVDTIQVPYGELDLETLRSIHKALDVYNVS